MTGLTLSISPGCSVLVAPGCMFVVPCPLEEWQLAAVNDVAPHCPLSRLETPIVRMQYVSFDHALYRANNTVL